MFAANKKTLNAFVKKAQAKQPVAKQPVATQPVATQVEKPKKESALSKFSKIQRTLGRF